MDIDESIIQCGHILGWQGRVYSLSDSTGHDDDEVLGEKRVFEEQESRFTKRNIFLSGSF